MPRKKKTASISFLEGGLSAMDSLPGDIRRMIDDELAELDLAVLDALADDLADAIARQARELWQHLPDGEIADDERLHFRTNAEGNLMVYVAATGCTYLLREGAAWKLRQLSDGRVAVECWRDGALVDSAVAGADATAGGDPSWN